jgi:hypothetical protein
MGLQSGTVGSDYLVERCADGELQCHVFIMLQRGLKPVACCEMTMVELMGLVLGNAALTVSVTMSLPCYKWASCVR